MMGCGCQQCGGDCQQQSGMGFLALEPAIAGGAAVGGPIGAVVGAVVGVIGSIASLFGGGVDDQATNYRPPADSAERFVQFSDSQGTEEVAYDATSQQSLQIGINNGNRVEDIYSYYSAFINNSVNAGASSAAAKVIMDVVNKYSVSISRAADMVLKVVGLIRRVRQLTSPTTQQQPTYTQPRPIPQPAPYVQQYPVSGYTQQTATQQQAQQTTGGGSSDNSGVLLLGGGLLLFLVLARRRD